GPQARSKRARRSKSVSGCPDRSATSTRKGTSRGAIVAWAWAFSSSRSIPHTRLSSTPSSTRTSFRTGKPNHEATKTRRTPQMGPSSCLRRAFVVAFSTVRHGGPAMDHSIADILWRLAGVLALVFANGFFVAAEFSIVTVRKTRIDQLVAEGDRRARAVRRAVSDPDPYIAATQLGITMASI